LIWPWSGYLLLHENPWFRCQRSFGLCDNANPTKPGEGGADRLRGEAEAAGASHQDVEVDRMEATAAGEVEAAQVAGGGGPEEPAAERRFRCRVARRRPLHSTLRLGQDSS
jgi:hypothetical protein